MTGRLLLACALAALSAACAHQRFSNPEPPGPTAAWCQGFLDPGQRCRVLVHANHVATSTSLVVTPGQRYHVLVAPEQQWCDARDCTTAPRGQAGKPWMNAFTRLRRDREVEWFTLMVAVVRDSEGRHRIGESQAVESEPVVEVQHTGLLALYPNDVPGFYWNNRGDILACIERLAPGAAPLSAPGAGEPFCPPRH